MFVDIILEVMNFNHTWMGDVVLRLEYADCATGTGALRHQRGLPSARNQRHDQRACGNGTGIGCSGNFGSSAANTPQPGSVIYRFTDAALAPIGDGVCPTVAPTGCYKPSPGGVLAGFNGLLKGGCWQLRAADWAALDVGFINSWTVWELNQTPVNTQVATWGKLKTLYR